MHGGDIYRNDVELDFSVNINPFGIAENVKAAALNAMERAENYPDINCGELRTALAEKLDISKESIIFGNGASELFNALLLALRPEKTIVAEPSFTGYRRAVKAAGSALKVYYLSAENDFSLDEAFLEELDRDIDFIILANPNNPTGKMIDPELLERIIKKAGENGTKILLDECFMTLSGKNRTDSLLRRTEEFPNLWLVRSFTKTFAIPGLRLGYMISSDKALIDKVSLCLGEWNVSVVAQEAGLAALEADDYLKKTIEFISSERLWFVDELKKIGYNVIDSEADFIMFRADKGLDRKLLGYKILIRNCEDYPGLDESWYRIAVKKHEDNLRLLKIMSGKKTG
ncbi:pyridoxal phosphate-dependent aminotransferase [Lachnospiraceae bacterium C1.1]|nr:histidinol-phosphate transaminase [Lachnospiraceae bacterium C1.1]